MFLRSAINRPPAQLQNPAPLARLPGPGAWPPSGPGPSFPPYPPGLLLPPAHICTHRRPNNYALPHARLEVRVSPEDPVCPRPPPKVLGSPRPGLRTAAGCGLQRPPHLARQDLVHVLGGHSPASAALGLERGAPEAPRFDPGPAALLGAEHTGKAGSGCSREAPGGGRRSRGKQRAGPRAVRAAAGSGRRRLGERRLAHSPQSGEAARRGSGTGPGGASAPGPSGFPRSSPSRCRPRSR